MKSRTWATRVLGMDLPRELMPLLGVSLLSSCAFSAFWSFIGIWAIHVLGCRATTVGVMYAGDSLASALLGYYGGRLSDRLGRRLVISASWAFEALAALVLVWAGHHVVWGLIWVVVAGAASGPGLAATGALVADLSDEEDRIMHYGAYRVTTNLGAMAGPVLGGLALLSGHWPVFFGGIAVLGCTAALMAWRWLLPGGAAQGLNMADRPRHSGLGLLRDGPFLLLLASTFGGFLVYVGFDVMLPIATVQSYGLAPSTWGFLAVVDPLMVVLWQSRLSGWTSGFQPERLLLFSMSLMGSSFLILLVWHDVASILMSLCLFGLGEMVWSPLAQALAARLAQDQGRGAYLGAFSAAGSSAWVVGPLFDLRLAGFSVNAVWIFLAGSGIVAGSLGWGSVRWGANLAERKRRE